LKDFGKMGPQAAAALTRLENAVKRLEAASVNATARLPVAAEAGKLRQDLDQLKQAHAALKATSGKVAQRLDGTIGKLSAALKD